MSSLRDDFQRYESLPDWARTTLEEHRRDPRPDLYSLDDLEHARTHDEVWNAAQRYMSSDSARRKLDLGPYLAEFGPLSLETGAGSSKPSS